jgi:hypothetical protein
MAQKIYFSRITADHWSARNNLDKAAHNLAREMDRRLLSENEIMDFRVELLDKMEKLNQEFHRCKPLRVSMHESHSCNGDYSIYCDGVFHMGLFLVKDKN